MEKAEFKRIMAFMTAAVNTDKPITAATIEAYYELLRDLPVDLCRAAVAKVLGEDEYRLLPTAGAIRKAAQFLASPSKLTYAQAWEQVLRAIHKYGSYQEREAMESLPPEAAEAARQMGWQEICGAQVSQVSVLRGQFRAIYEGNQERKEQVERLPAAARSFVEQIEGPLIEIWGGAERKQIKESERGEKRSG